MKSKIIISVISIIVFSGFGYLSYSVLYSMYMKGIILESKEVAEAYISMYSEELDIDKLKSNEVFSDDICEILKEYQNQLKQKNNNYLDLNSYYLKYYNDEYSGELSYIPEVGENVESISVVGDMIVKGVENDRRIKIKDGKDIIMVNDLVFNSNGYDTLMYKGILMQINKDDVEETYDMIIKNPEYKMKAVRYEFSKDKKHIDFYLNHN